MTFRCKICNKITEGKNNRFYCEKCSRAMKTASSHWEIGKEIHIWIRNNRPMRVVVRGQEILDFVFAGKEVLD